MGWGGAGLSDPWHAGGRSSTAAAEVLSMMLTHTHTHMGRTNLTVATAQILVIFIHDMVIIN